MEKNKIPELTSIVFKTTPQAMKILTQGKKRARANGMHWYVFVLKAIAAFKP